MSPVLATAIDISFVLVMLGIVAAALGQRASKKDPQPIRSEVLP